ncbi:hypothetical protein NHQ30_011417 [Ciborinia camelliae]|nr:hypothetical protein NHQ30_011417 [Ciborinia camelliae]
MTDDNLAYGTMDTDRPEIIAGGNERVERPKNDRIKTTYTFPIKIMPSPKSTTTSTTTSSTSLAPEFSEFETQAYYNESLDYNYISSRFAFSLGLRPDADRVTRPRSKSVSKPKTPFKPKGLVRSQTAPVSEIKPVQRSRTEPLSRRIFSPLSRESTISEDASPNPLPPRIPPRRTSTTATLVPSNSQPPDIFSLLEPTPEAIARSNLTSPLFPDSDLNPFSPRPGATFGAMVVDTPPRTPLRQKPLHSHTEGQPSLFEALNSHPVIPITNHPTILTEEPEGMTEEPLGISEEPERNLEGMGTGTGIGMGFGIGEEIRGREQNQDPNTMSGDLTLHWKSSPLSRYTQRTIFWIVPHATFDIVFGHDETDFNIPIHVPPKWGLGGWGLGGGRRGRGERNQFREGIRRGVLKKIEDPSHFSLLHSATNIMDAWLRPPYPTHRSLSSLSDCKTPLLGNPKDGGNDHGRHGLGHDVPLTYPELETQLRNELHCTDERRRKHESKRAVNIWDVRAGKAVLAEQAKGASGEIRKLVGAVVKDVRERDGGIKSAGGGERDGLKEGSPLDVDQDARHPNVTNGEDVSGNGNANGNATLTTTTKETETPIPTQGNLTSQPQPQPILQTNLTLLNPGQATLSLPNPQSFELSPQDSNFNANENANLNESPNSSPRGEFSDAQLQAQIEMQMEREAEREAEREVQRQLERDVQRQIDSEIRMGMGMGMGMQKEKLKNIEEEGEEGEGEGEGNIKTLIPKPRQVDSASRGSHRHEEDDGDAQDDDDINESMSEIAVSRIPLSISGRGLANGNGNVNGIGVKERFEKIWEKEDEAVHFERKVWRKRFRGVLEGLVRGRGW